MGPCDAAAQPRGGAPAPGRHAVGAAVPDPDEGVLGARGEAVIDERVEPDESDPGQGGRHRQPGGRRLALHQGTGVDRPVSGAQQHAGHVGAERQARHVPFHSQPVALIQPSREDGLGVLQVVDGHRSVAPAAVEGEGPVLVAEVGVAESPFLAPCLPFLGRDEQALDAPGADLVAGDELLVFDVVDGHVTRAAAHEEQVALRAELGGGAPPHVVRTVQLVHGHLPSMGVEDVVVDIVPRQEAVLIALRLPPFYVLHFATPLHMGNRLRPIRSVHLVDDVSDRHVPNHHLAILMYSNSYEKLLVM
mmetsp:Transcript_27502/g.49538  ORF Transcript_27502/g.49538 Transcript_27502/m.49538 type:complete len:305 (-) Transcript_27502:397-1311(-)